MESKYKYLVLSGLSIVAIKDTIDAAFAEKRDFERMRGDHVTAMTAILVDTLGSYQSPVQPPVIVLRVTEVSEIERKPE